MSTIKEAAELGAIPTQCYVCGGSASAAWWGVYGAVPVCRVCALEKTTLLIADALSDTDLTPERLEHIETRIIATFRRGVMLRQIRKRQAAKRTDGGVAW